MSFTILFTIVTRRTAMLVQAQKYLRLKNLIPADRYLKKDSFGTSRTQEKRRPARTDVVSVQKPTSKANAHVANDNNNN